MNRLVYCLGLGCFLLANVARAADIPAVQEGASQFNKEQCTQKYSDECINNTCVNSDDVDCQPKCRQMATDKCMSMSD